MFNAKTLITTVAALALATTMASAQDRQLNIYNWSDYIDDSILTDFTAETGIKVTYDVFDSNELLETKMLAGGSGYDIVVPTGTFLGNQIKAGVFQKLDKTKLTNWENLDKGVLKHLSQYDPGNEHAFNYLWGTTGIGYNVEKIKEVLGEDYAPNNLDMIFDPAVASKLADCGIYILDTADEVFPAALNYLGINPDSDEREDFEKAAELLLKVRPYIRKFHSSEYINALANGDICVAFGWSGDILQARDRAAEANAGVSVDYAIPKQGAMMWFDNFAIPADAPHVAEAHEFLNYMLRPEVIAKASNYVYYANGNEASKPLLNEDVIGDPAIYPDMETMEKLFTTSSKDQKVTRVRTRLWTTVVTGQ